MAKNKIAERNRLKGALWDGANEFPFEVFKELVLTELTHIERMVSGFTKKKEDE